MPPSPAGGRKWRKARSCLVGAGVPTAPQHMGMACFHLRRIRIHPVGNAVLGVSRSSTEPEQAVRRIRIYPVGRADPGAPRSKAYVFRNFGRNRKRLPVEKGPTPSGRKCPDVRRPWSNPQPYSAFAWAFPCRTVCCAERASPFPTVRWLRICPRFWESRCCCRNVEDDVPYIEMLRIRLTWRLTFGVAAGRVRDFHPIERALTGRTSERRVAA